MTFKKFLYTVQHRHNLEPYKNILRYGQVIMNELYIVWPEKYNQILGSDYDCFYDDNKTDITLDKLKNEWHEKTR